MYHMLSPSHQPLVDNLGGIVAASVNVDTLLHHRV